MAPVSGSDSMGIRVIVIGVVFSIVAVAAVTARFWARRLRKATLQTNDYLILAALVCNRFQGISTHADTPKVLCAMLERFDHRCCCFWRIGPAYVILDWQGDDHTRQSELLQLGDGKGF